MPRPFNSLVQNALIAEARSVKIGALVGENGRWYTFGKMVVDLLNDPQAKELADILKLTLKGRLPDLMDQSQHFTGTASAAARSSGDEVGAEFRSGLDATERELTCDTATFVNVDTLLSEAHNGKRVKGQN
ncbi:DNA replication protein [Serendipita sp. 396]|nr:DNA replication protein [Serendipita sp. 396]